MNMPNTTSGTFWAGVRGQLPTLAALVLLMFAPGPDSLWIDEGQLVGIVHSERFLGMLDVMKLLKGSESQMPLALAYFWAWGQTFGYAEWILRAGNLLPLAIGVLMLARIGRKTGAWYLPLLFAVNPLVWFYANEVRPYALQLSGGCGLCLAMAMTVFGRRFSAKEASVLGASSLVVTGASMLGLFAVIATVVALVVLIWRGKYPVTRPAMGVLAGFVMLFGVLGLYFLWSMRHAGGGVGSRDVGLGNVAFVLYENLGLGGVGPSRTLLREANNQGMGKVMEALRPGLPWFAVIAGLWLWFLKSAWSGLRHDPGSRDDGDAERLFWFFGGTFVLGVGAFYVAAVVVGFPFYGRHLSPFSPMLIAAISMGCVLARRIPGRSRACLPACMALAWLGSSLVQRFSPEHAKDDYRSASAYALKELRRGNDVWWVAAYNAAAYYGLDYRMSGLVVPYFSKDNLGDLWYPAVIVYSKPDLHDTDGRVMKYIMANGYRPVAGYPAFRIYRQDSGGKR
jgi:hypothetical protein